jgi:hypothetical protein
MEFKYVLFEASAIEFFVHSQEYQHYDSEKAKDLIQKMLNGQQLAIPNMTICKGGTGLIFIGNSVESKKQVLLFDLTQCELFEIEAERPENILSVLQKTFRSAIKFWRDYPFNASERVVGNKLVVFPFSYNFGGKGNKRVVLERQPKLKNLQPSIDRPFLAYKYNSEDVQNGTSEIPETNILEIGLREFILKFDELSSKNTQEFDDNNHPDDKEKVFHHEITCKGSTMHEGFKYMGRDNMVLTESQKKVVNTIGYDKPFRVEGPAGTGKTMSLILRAQWMLQMHRDTNEPFKIVFFAHSESTRHEIEEIFRMKCPESLIEKDSPSIQNSNQTIEVTTLLEWCKRFVGFEDAQLVDTDALDAKDYQRILIETVYKEVYRRYHKTYRALMSEALNSVLCNSEDSIMLDVLTQMLQHEFSVQIKGRSDGKYENYKDLSPVKYGLPVRTEREKEFVFKIFQAYQEYLESIKKYDTDDVVIEAIQRLNAPRWRRARAAEGFDYIFVDEMHLFNTNEQYAFDYLTKELNQADYTDQKEFPAKARRPICFALDYSQAIGDRGLAYNNDFIELEVSDDEHTIYNTVFRSSKSITDFCASIISAGTGFFKADFLNPYGDSARSAFSAEEESKSRIPQLFMYNNDDEMINSIKKHIAAWRKEGAFKDNYDVAVISFISQLLCEETAKEKIGGRDFFLLKSRNAEGLSREVKLNQKHVMSSPDNVNGLEFRCVILVGVDGRVPPQIDSNAISTNYLRYAALNQLYLCSSRAKYRLIILGSTPYNKSTCLKYALDNGTLEEVTTSES